MENVITSLDDYVYDNLYTTKGLTIDWEGGDSIDLTNIDEWIQPRLMGGFPQYLHWVAGNRLGQNTHLMYNINIFVKRGAKSTSSGNISKNRLMQIRDMVAEYFYIGKEIPLKDYAGASAELGHMIIRNIDTDTVVPPAAARIEQESTYYQWNYTPDIVVVQRWAK
jgi:hypothetical protein